MDRNVPYRGNTGDEYASKMCRLDIAYQPDVQNAPVVVWFHGGGLTGGSREIPSGLLTDGMVVVGVEYRLSPHVKTMEIVDDAAAAVAWVFDNIGKYGGDTSSIYIAGHSAGGYLVDMVGLDKKLLGALWERCRQACRDHPFQRPGNHSFRNPQPARVETFAADNRRNGSLVPCPE